MPGAWVAAVICDCVRARAIGHTGRPCSQQWDAVFVCSLPHPPPSSSVACFPDIAFPPDPSPLLPPPLTHPFSFRLTTKAIPHSARGRPRVACGQCRDGTDGTAAGQPEPVWQPSPPCITGNPLLRPGPPPCRMRAVPLPTRWRCSKATRTCLLMTQPSWPPTPQRWRSRQISRIPPLGGLNGSSLVGAKH